MYTIKRLGVVSMGKLFALVGTLAGFGNLFSLWWTDHLGAAAQGSQFWYPLSHLLDGSVPIFVLVMMLVHIAGGFLLGVVQAVLVNLGLQAIGGLEMDIR